jgi:uncharacterized protein (TIGR04255 family)
MRVTFDAPPLNEVSLGRVFLPRPDLLVPHYGAFWERVRADFPNLAHAPLIAEAGEQLLFDERGLIPRLWFISRDSSRLIQLQQNRFHYNWRRTPESSEYIRFPAIQEMALKLWELFGAFVRDETRTELVPVSNELTYSNVVEAVDGQSAVSLADAVLRDSMWHKHQRYLDAPVQFNQTCAFTIPGDVGELTVQAVTGSFNTNGRPLLKIDLTARSKKPQVAEASFQKWSDDAHDFLVAAFKDITAPAMHAEWQLREGPNG